MQDADQHERQWLGEVERVSDGRVGEDLLRLAQVRLDVGAAALRGAGQQRPRVGEHDRVVVDVYHPGLRRRLLRHLVHVVRTGQARPDVQELPDTGLVHQVAHRTAEESPVLPGGGAPGGDGRDRFLGSRPVHGEMVFPAEKVVVYARGVRLRGIDLRSHLPRFRIDTALAVFARIYGSFATLLPAGWASGRSAQ